MVYRINASGRWASDERARTFLSRWSRAVSGESGNFQMYLLELVDLLGLPRPEPSLSGVGRFVFERRVTFGNGRRGRIDLYRADCFVMEAKCYGGAGEGQPGRVVHRGTERWERRMREAAEQGVRYARALAHSGLTVPFVLALDVGYALDAYWDASGTGGPYVPYPAPRRNRILIEDLVREEVRERIRRVLSGHQNGLTREVRPAGSAAQPARLVQRGRSRREGRVRGGLRHDRVPA